MGNGRCIVDAAVEGNVDEVVVDDAVADEVVSALRCLWMRSKIRGRDSDYESA